MLKVFFLPWAKKDRLAELIEKSGAAESVQPGDFAAIKMHFGEKGSDGYIKPEFTRPIIKLIRDRKARGFLTDTGTIYHGKRSHAIEHLALAALHGFSENRLHVPVIIADGLTGNDHREIEITGGRHFKRVKIAGAICEANSIVALSHFKGHLLSGFGGALKNIGMGCSNRLGKFEMHSSVAPKIHIEKCIACGACVAKCAQGALTLTNEITLNTNLCAGCGECVVACNSNALSVGWNKEGHEVEERFVEYAKGALKGKRAFFFNFVNHVTKNCDCMGLSETPLVEDIGILASSDPVAIDQASLDMVIKKAGCDIFAKEWPNVDGTVQLRHAEKLGLGQRQYELVII